MNTDERQLAEVLHRVTPEPPRRVTVEDVAFRLAHEAEGARGGHREPRPRRGPAWTRGRGWAPVLAAASVFVVAGASAGIATVMTSHPSHATSSGGGPSSFSASASTVPSSAGPSQPTASPGPTWTQFPPEGIAGGTWGAELINPQSFTQASLAAGYAGVSSLYATSPGYLDRISPVTGEVLAEVPYTSPIPGYPNRPVVTYSQNTVWVLSSYSGSNLVLTGYNGTTLGRVASVTVPVSGQVSSTPQGVLTSNGAFLYVAAGNSVAVVQPETRQVLKQIPTSGQVSSVAVAPDGKLYISTGALKLLAYNQATGAQLSSSATTGLSSTGGNLVATSGGVWGTVGVGMAEWVWFAPNGDLSQVIRVGQGTGAGLDSVPTFSGGTVWIGGSHTLACASPATGQVLASTAIPADNGIVEYFGSVTVAGNGRTYALYQNQAAQQSGVAALTPPAACSG